MALFFLSLFFSLFFIAGGSFRCFCQMTTCHNQGCLSAPLNSNPAHAQIHLVPAFFFPSFLVTVDLTARHQALHLLPPSLACIHIKSHHHRPPAVRAPRFTLWQRRGLFARKKLTRRAGEMSLMVVRQTMHCKYTRGAQCTVH